MIDALPTWIEIVFILTTIFSIVGFYFSLGSPKKLIALILGWAILHSILATNLFYRVTDSIPPRFIIVLLPTTILIVYGLTGKRKNWMIQNKNLKISTFIHAVRVPVEIALLQLYLHSQIPQNLTYEGRNFDIVMGITAPIIGFLFIKKLIGLKALLIWNIIGMFFILFILTDGILSSELPFQQFAFDMPNKGMTYFPFILLPAVIVPIVIYTHLSDILKIKSILKSNK